MQEIIEEFISGFCRTGGGMQTVTCEYTKQEDGYRLEMMDCAHKKCLHHGACEIYKQAQEKERTGM